MNTVEKETRRFTRVSTEGTVQFYDGSGTLNRANLCDVSYGGLRMALGRYIRPQTLVQVPVAMENHQLSFPARVAWCIPAEDNQRFYLGLKADHGGKYTMAILSSWVLDAVQAGNSACACPAEAAD